MPPVPIIPDNLWWGFLPKVTSDKFPCRSGSDRPRPLQHSPSASRPASQAAFSDAAWRFSLVTWCWLVDRVVAPSAFSLPLRGRHGERRCNRFWIWAVRCCINCKWRRRASIQIVKSSDRIDLISLVIRLGLPCYFRIVLLNVAMWTKIIQRDT